MKNELWKLLLPGVFLYTLNQRHYPPFYTISTALLGLLLALGISWTFQPKITGNGVPDSNKAWAATSADLEEAENCASLALSAQKAQGSIELPPADPGAGELTSVVLEIRADYSVSFLKKMGKSNTFNLQLNTALVCSLPNQLSDTLYLSADYQMGKGTGHLSEQGLQANLSDTSLLEWELDEGLEVFRSGTPVPIRLDATDLVEFQKENLQLQSGADAQVCITYLYN